MAELWPNIQKCKFQSVFVRHCIYASKDPSMLSSPLNVIYCARHICALCVYVVNLIFNPRHTCAAMVTVLGLSVCLSP